MYSSQRQCKKNVVGEKWLETQCKKNENSKKVMDSSKEKRILRQQTIKVPTSLIITFLRIKFNSLVIKHDYT